MFEDRIVALNKDTEAMPSIPYEKRIYTVDSVLWKGINRA